MTAVGDQLVLRHRDDVVARVRAVRGAVEQLVLESGLPERGDVRDLVGQFSDPLLVASADALAAHVHYAEAYAAAESGPPPATAAPLVPSEDTQEGLAELVIVARTAIKLSRGRRERPDETRGLLAVVLGSQASKVALHDARTWATRYLTTDRGVRAYRRVPDGHPCAFCAMLAGRGFTYRTRESAGDVRVVQGWHPACACTSQAGFVGRELPALDSVAEEAARVYEESTGPHEGREKLRAFRRAWESRRQR